jgi:flagellar basal-body rod protein FlgB
MNFNLDQVFAPHLRALQVGNQRMELLAANIANAETPGFLARDVDFRAAMSEASADQFTGQLHRTTAGHIAASGNTGPAEALYRTAVQPSLDGNTVDTERESAAVAETAVRYEAALMFFNSKIRGLRTAITGGR